MSKAHTLQKIDRNQDLRSRQLIAVEKIEQCYISYRDRQMFTMLKHAIRAAEKSWTYDVIRKVSPREGELLKDSSLNTKIRFRFAGVEFPPIILFKIYIVNQGTKYYSGRNQITPTSIAANEALGQMGHRRFYDQMIIDACQLEKDKIVDEVDVHTTRDYMQFQNNMDETPSYLGGRNNYWRKLTLENMPRHSIVYDIVEYLQTKTVNRRLKENMQIIMSRPLTREAQEEQFRIVTNLQSSSPSPMTKYFSSGRDPKTPKSTGRRSVQSRRRTQKMRMLYQTETCRTDEQTTKDEQQCDEDDDGASGDSHSTHGRECSRLIAMRSPHHHPSQCGSGEQLHSRPSGKPPFWASSVPKSVLRRRESCGEERMQNTCKCDDDADAKEMLAAPIDSEVSQLFEWTEKLNVNDLNN